MEGCVERGRNRWDTPMLLLLCLCLCLSTRAQSPLVAGHQHQQPPRHVTHAVPPPHMAAADAGPRPRCRSGARHHAPSSYCGTMVQRLRLHTAARARAHVPEKLPRQRRRQCNKYGTLYTRQRAGGRHNCGCARIDGVCGSDSAEGAELELLLGVQLPPP